MKWSKRLMTVIAADAAVGLSLLAATPFVYARIAAFGAPAGSLQWDNTAAVALVQALLSGVVWAWLQRNSLRRGPGWRPTAVCFAVPAALLLVAVWGVIQGTPAQAARQGYYVYEMAVRACFVPGASLLLAAIVLAVWYAIELQLRRPSNQRIEQTAKT